MQICFLTDIAEKKFTKNNIIKLKEINCVEQNITKLSHIMVLK